MKERDDGLAPVTVRSQQQVESPTSNLVLPIRFVGHLKKATQTPSVKNCERWIAVNTAPIDILDFIDGQEGQELKILGDGQTSVQHTSNIKNNTAATKLLAVDIVYTFTMFDGCWVENE